MKFDYAGCNYIHIYYIASSVSWQDEPNPALWSPTQASKMELSCLLRTTCCAQQEKFLQKLYNKFFIDQACSLKMAGYWPHSFFACLWNLDSVSVYKHAISSHPDLTLGQYRIFTFLNPNLRASQNLSELTSWANASTITEKVTCTLPVHNYKPLTETGATQTMRINQTA